MEEPFTVQMEVEPRKLSILGGTWSSRKYPPFIFSRVSKYTRKCFEIQKVTF
jgi:hypothetical protein